ncbi:8-amino-7-oxononanoate synthase [Hoeflea prorocentri]|uniref:8-amino-7-oxononanoate synthase n=1 Tax=Hoeflea prorocentri TaxID=1922333 RepID=A0A9X3ULH6_9HYPH|nr:8-amino-7-oxononanoate synthase [Hoeflea prorocentri]MCY6382610.1 8-amino-7-oxononanoate synthase [Hoeflea prorocentri]MDA5400410.1 8-amino-7-oxononanoate synthase [Hoeflea prorocentri]
MLQRSDGSGRLTRYRTSLRRLATRGRLRGLSARSGVDFSSNDYLGLAGDKRIAAALNAALSRGVPAGAGGSRLLRGNDPEHEMLEQEAAVYFGSETALYFGSGFMANYALLACLPQRDDLVVMDELIHASARDGANATKAAVAIARHNDPQSFADAISTWRKSGGRGRPWLVFESLYSMDGDRAPLDDLVSTADVNDGFLIVDEAHATGVFGPHGRGLAADFEGRDNVIVLHTCGKALGASGALICLPEVLAGYMINRSRPFIYATAPSPLMAAAVREALLIVEQEPERRKRLQRMMKQFGDGLTALGLPATDTQIHPVVIGDAEKTMSLATAMQDRGFDIRGIRPPTVPEGTSRLRISLTLNARQADVETLLEALGEKRELFDQ